MAARIEASDVLGRLGDPRFCGEFLLPDFITIPSERFLMGSENGEKGARENEKPRHPVDLDAFALARFPTTNAMYRCFVEAGGYGDGRWWTEAEAAEVWRPGGTVKGRWDNEARVRPEYWDDDRLKGPNQPVVGITWYEALAYCRWLTAALDNGHWYRLPSEAEWERAARGLEERRYPWGKEWEEGKANTEELGLKRTTPVGIFIDGASAEGLLDLSGNVWEWCNTSWARYPYDAADGREELGSTDPRVLRGGAYWNDRSWVRCASRNYDDPGYWSIIYGFRVARVPV